MTRSTHDQPARLGFLYPGHAAEDDYPRMADMLAPSVAVRVVHTSVGEDAHRVDALLDLGAHQRLLDGAREITQFSPDAVMWSCTSGSFVFGWDGASEQVTALEQQLGVPTSSTSFAFVHAARALGVQRVAVAATYPADVADRFRDFLSDGGVDVIRSRSHDIETAAEAGILDTDRVRRMAVVNNTTEAEAVLLPDTALHTATCLDELENACGKPVLTANQVSFWMALRMAGRQQARAALGQLFRYPLLATEGA